MAVDNLTPEQKGELALIREVRTYWHDPARFVKYAFPWGEGELADAEIEDWQEEFLEEIGEVLRDGTITKKQKQIYVGEAIQAAIASGHGIGKSAIVCWLILWAISTFEDTRGVITANTKTQLSTKTWAELAKWHRLCICGHWFKYEKTSIHHIDPKHEETWRIDAIPWSKQNPEAFAGLHNKGKRILLIFDEASAIEDIIWETSEGALTDSETEIIWAAFGNPTRNTGRFRECWRKFKGTWKMRKQIDSRTVRITNKKNLQAKIEAWGEDSDYCRVRIKGTFPRQSERQFIGGDIVSAARGRHVKEHMYSFAAKILTCDPAWTGGDETVIGIRQGLAYRQLAAFPRNDDDSEVAGMLARFEDEEKADAVFIDQGYGTGIYSCGKLLNRKWTLIAFGSKASKPGFKNKRAEMWSDTKDWLKAGGCIPDDQVIEDDLIGPEAQVLPNGELLLESKQHMKDRGVESPNRADALALSFALPVQKKSSNRRGRGRGEFARGGTRDGGYDPYG